MTRIIWPTTVGKAMRKTACVTPHLSKSSCSFSAFTLLYPVSCYFAKAARKKRPSLFLRTYCIIWAIEINANHNAKSYHKIYLWDERICFWCTYSIGKNLFILLHLLMNISKRLILMDQSSRECNIPYTARAGEAGLLPIKHIRFVSCDFSSLLTA